MSKKYWETYFNAIKKQDWEHAKSSLEYLANTEHNNPNVQLKLGDIYQRTGKTSQAITAYHKSAWMLVKQGFNQKALALYKIILRLDSYNEEAINRSNELMMEIESTRKQSSAMTQFATSFEAGAEQKTETETGLSLGTPEDTLEEDKPSIDISDIIESTSHRDKPVETHIEPTKIFEQEKVDRQPTNMIGETTPSTEEPVADMPSLFSSLPKDEIEYLNYKTEPHIFLPRQLILEEGDAGDSIFFIKSGRAKVVSHILGKEIELAILSPGDLFGEVAFLTGRPRTASVIALDKLEVTEFKKFLLEEIFERYPSTLEKLYNFYHCRVEDTLQKVKKEFKKKDM